MNRNCILLVCLVLVVWLLCRVVKNNMTNVILELKYLEPIPKKIHISWKDKNVINLNLDQITYGIRNLRDMNPDWEFTISDDTDVRQYIKNRIPIDDYDRIKNRDIVENVDLWRLLKMYYEGGFYMDIDRFYNIPLSEILKENTRLALPTWEDQDFAQDIMISSRGLSLHGNTIKENLKLRERGERNVYAMGPGLYLQTTSEFLSGNRITSRYAGKSELDKLRKIINNTPEIITYRDGYYDSIVFRNGPELDVHEAKKELYRHYNIVKNY